MRFESKEIKDKLGRTVLLRGVMLSDADALIRYLQVTAAETPYLLREPDEIALIPEQERAFIQSRIDDPKALMLIAELDGKHVGCCSLIPVGSFRRYAHRCDVSIALYREYCDLGIGRQMMQTALDAARSVGYEQAELEVIAGNTRAKHLYESLGFEVYGRFPDNMKYADGAYADAEWMMKKL